MAIINSDDPVLAKRLRDHVLLLEAAGGWVNPDLVIRSADGEISLAHAGEITPETRLVWVPDECLVSVDPWILRRHGEEILPNPVGSTLRPRQLRILEVQCEILNLTGKLGKARNRLPRLALRDAPELLDSLTMRRFSSQSETRRPAAGGPAEPPDTLLDTFLQSRVLRPRVDGALEKPESFLMSLIDYQNHHSQAGPYLYRRDDRSLFVEAWRTRNGDDECFVRYMTADAHALYLSHGFIDTSATFTWTSTFQITVEDIGVIHVLGGQRGYQDPSEATPLAERTRPGPALDLLPNGDMRLSNLGISNEGDRSTLRRNLTIALLSWKKNLSQESMTGLVDSLERDVVSRTLAYYDQLRETALRHQDHLASADVVRLADFHRRSLERYQRCLG